MVLAVTRRAVEGEEPVSIRMRDNEGAEDKSYLVENTSIIRIHPSFVEKETFLHYSHQYVIVSTAGQTYIVYMNSSRWKAPLEPSTNSAEKETRGRAAREAPLRN